MRGMGDFVGGLARVSREPQYASIGDVGSANISAQIFNDAFAIAEGLEVHTPILFPNRGINGREG